MTKTTICVLIMATNEEHCILETLNATLPYATEYIFLDNASTDNTVQVCKDFFKKHYLTYKIFHYHWVNFGHNYSYLYELGFKHSTCEYLWQIDADDLVVGTMNIENLNKDKYMLQFGKDFKYVREQIFKNNRQWHHYLAIHGYVAPFIGKRCNVMRGKIEGDYYIDSRRIGNRHKIMDTQTKYLNDAKTIIEDLKTITDKEDKNRYYFYLGQSYHDGFDYENSIINYHIRIGRGGWEEEIYYSRLMIGKCYCNLKKYDKAKQMFLKCYNYHSDRAEPLYFLGKLYYDEGDYENSIRWLEIAIQIPFPYHRVLFQFKNLYDYEIGVLLANAYYHFDKFEESYNLNVSLLESNLVPDNFKKLIDNNNKLNKSKFNDKNEIVNSNI